MKNFIADFRKSKGFTQRQLAEALNLHYQAVQRWERGEQTPSVDAALRLAKALDTTVESLFSIDD